MKNYLLGIIGALLGGFIFAIPWVLMYVYGEFILSLLAALIAFGALLGYKFFKGKVDKKTPIIITVVSLIVVVVTTLLIIPACLISKEGLSVNEFTFRLLYYNDDFVSALMRDLVISVVFTFLGISGVIRKLKEDLGMVPRMVPETQVKKEESKVVDAVTLENKEIIEDTKEEIVDSNEEDKYL